MTEKKGQIRRDLRCSNGTPEGFRAGRREMQKNVANILRSDFWNELFATDRKPGYLGSCWQRMGSPMNA